MDIKVASYNIHAGVGHDQQFDMHRIVAVIQELDADVIALQEVEHQLIEGEHLLEFIAIKTSYKVISGITFDRGEHPYGNVLLSRHTIQRFICHDISVGNREPRGLIEAHLVIEGSEIVIMATHFGLRPFERRQQVKKVLSLLAINHSHLTILMGDLNEWFLWGRPLRWLQRYFRQSRRLATFPAKFPLLSLDHIWVSPASSLLDVAVHHSALAKVASDHLPICANIKIPTELEP
jgi:endonuclease/exonuclease/phosphatase family metal-dependent hydrolase